MALTHEKPNPALMAELHEVVQAVQELSDAKTNWLPDGFERGELKAMLATLRNLPLGTAFGAQVNLRAGKAELQNIEDVYFKTDAAVAEATDEAVSHLSRRSDFGRAVTHLKGTVDNALNQCRKQAHTTEAEDAAPETERRADILATPARADLEARLQAVEQAMHAARDEVEAVFLPDAPSREPLRRILQDTENTSRMARAVTGLKSGSKWVWVGLGKALKAVSKVTIKIMNGVKVANEVARVGTAGWAKIQKILTTAGHDIVDEVADTLIRGATILDQAINPETPPLETPPPETPPPVDPDVQKAAEAEAFHLLAQNRAVPDDIARNVRVLNLRETGFTDTELLSNIKWLTDLTLMETKVADLIPLSGLKHLNYLDLDQTSVEDLSPLSGLKYLYYLNLGQTSVKDLSPLSGLGKLEWLDLNQTSVKDLSPLSGLVQLKTLYLDQTSVEDLSPLRGLDKLKSLDLNQTAVEDLSPLRGLGKLERLDLNQTSVEDLSPLRGLVQLEWLGLNQTSVEDLSPLSGLVQLETLFVSQTSVEDLSPLSGLAQLKWLWLSDTRVTDWLPVAHVEHVPGRPDDWENLVK